MCHTVATQAGIWLLNKYKEKVKYFFLLKKLMKFFNYIISNFQRTSTYIYLIFRTITNIRKKMLA